jgi:peptidoglycan/LPS O-acetylase OafA/YrhL
VSNASTYYKPLTGIRAVAAYMVYFHHYAPKSLTWFTDAFHEMHIGVTVFFTLSGLLITMRYLDQNQLSLSYLGRYFRNRIARIYPTYFLLTCGAFYFIAQKSGLNEGVMRAFVFNITFLRGFSDAYKFTGIAPGWSLTVEETFYLLAPLLLFGLARVRSWAYGLVLLAFVLLSLAVGVALTEANLSEPYGFFPTYNFLFMYTFFGRATEFAIGAGLALLLRQLATKRDMAPRAGLGWATWLGIAGVVATMPWLRWIANANGVYYSTELWQGSLVNNVALPIFVALLFFGLVTERSLVARLLASPLMQVLGKSSYCFYLIHVSFISDELITRYPVLRMQPLFFVILVLIAMALHYGFEEPVNRWIRRWFRKSEKAAVVLAPPATLSH